MTLSPPPAAGRRSPKRYGGAGAFSAEAGTQRGDIVHLAQFLPAVILLVLWLAWIPASGGYYTDVWYPSAIGTVGLLGVTAIGRRQVLPKPQAARVALLGFAALVAWNYLSILWASSPASALEASNQLLLYLVSGWIFSILPWTPRAVAAVLGAWVLGVAAICAVGLLLATSTSHLDAFFVEYRYATPLNYPNATAALAVMGMWPALILSARRELPAWLRGLLLAVAAFMAEFSLLPQSRGALLGLVLTAALVLCVFHDRIRLLPRIAIVGGGLAICVSRTVAVDDAINAGHHVGPVLQHAAAGMLFTSAGAFVLGGLLALVDRGWRAPASGLLRSRRAPVQPRARARVALAALVTLLVVATAAGPSIAHLARTVWRNGQHDAGTGSTRLISTTPEERFDYARVALRLFKGAPVVGVGAGNFGRHYDALRRFEKHSRYTHDVGLRVLSETGIVGLGLLVTVLGALAAGLLRSPRKIGALGRSCSVAALAIAAYFLAHGSLDWLDEFPALAAPALAFALAASSMPGRGPERGKAFADSRLRRFLDVQGSRAVGRVGGVIAVVLAIALPVLVLTGPYLETRFVERAFASFRARPTGAFDDLTRARFWNPLSADPVTAEGTIALELGEDSRARSAFERALTYENDWYPRLELALLDAQSKNFATATRELAGAALLDRDDPLMAQAKTIVERRQRIDPVEFNQMLQTGPSAVFFSKQRIK